MDAVYLPKMALRIHSPKSFVYSHKSKYFFIKINSKAITKMTLLSLYDTNITELLDIISNSYVSFLFPLLLLHHQ